MELINNRLVNLWRGSLEPPTKYHIWIKDKKLLLYDGEKWVVFIDHFSTITDINKIEKAISDLQNSTINNKKLINNPVLNALDILVGKDLKHIKSTDSIQLALEILDDNFNNGYPIKVVKNDDGNVSIFIGEHKFDLLSKGSIFLNTTSDNGVVIESTALNEIATQAPLEWTKERKLIHKSSGVAAGVYGPSGDQSNVETITVPGIAVDETGHVIKIENKNITIRDYVELIEDDKSNINRGVLLAYDNTDKPHPVIKGIGITYNNSSKKLTVEGGILSSGGISIQGGNLVVEKPFKIIGELEGSVTGEATPKIHLSKNTEYGVASTSLYGHVKIQDDLGTKAPSPSNINEFPDNSELPEGVLAVAASPLMVWNAKEEAKLYTDKSFSNDFEKLDDKFYIKWDNIEN